VSSFESLISHRSKTKMNTTTITLGTYLNNVQLLVIQSLLTPAYIIGNLNNLANILVFSQNSLRSHICSWYFIGASMGHIFYLNMGCLSRVIWGWTQYDLGYISPPFCKIRIYFVLDGLSISRYLFCLIAIDRWMITSRNNSIRQHSSPKVARRLIIGGVLFLLIINIFVCIGYVLDKIVGCGPSTDLTYSLFSTIYNTTLALGPLLTLFIFSSLTLLNIRSTVHNQVRPITQTTINPDILQRRRHHKKDVQFIKLSLMQVAVYVLFNTLHAYNTIYAIVIQNNIKTADQRAIDGFMYGMGLNLHYTYTAVESFLFFLSLRKICFLI
jgi:uncharacterized membrane protein (DUF485 family)